METTDFFRCRIGAMILNFAEHPMDALADADALAIVTEWKEFRSPAFQRMRSLMRQPVIFDGRNLYDPAAVCASGFDYQGIGRGKPPVARPSSQE